MRAPEGGRRSAYAMSGDRRDVTAELAYTDPPRGLRVSPD